MPFMDLFSSQQSKNEKLILASSIGDINKVIDLIRKKADVDTKDNIGWTPLMRASFSGYLDITNALLDGGADINLTGEKGWTALIVAVSNKQRETAKLLIRKGADTRAKSDKGLTPVSLAVMNDEIELVSILIKSGADLDVVHSEDKTTPLIIAAKNGNYHIAKMLIENGAAIDYEGEKGWTALFYGVMRGQTDIVKLLIEKGAAVNIRSNEGAAPLHAAVFNENLEMVRLLLKHGADINVRYNAALTPLFIAVDKCNCQIAEVLIESGADIEARNKDGESPLITAIKSGNISLIKLFLKDNTCGQRIFCEIETLYNNKKYDTIIKIIETGIDFGSKEADAMDYLGLCYGSTNKDDRTLAVSAFKKAIEINPLLLKPYLHLGAYLFNGKEYDEAETVYRDVLKIDPDNSEAYTALFGIIKETMGFDDAVESIKEEITKIRDKNNLANAQYYMSAILYENGFTDQAKKEMETAIDLNPENPENYNQLGIFYYEERDFDKAITQFSKGIELNPKYAIAHYNLAMSLNKKGLNNEAADAARNFLKYANPREHPGQIRETEQFLSRFPTVVSYEISGQKITRIDL